MSEITLHKSPQLDIFGRDFEQGQRIAKAIVSSLTWQAKFALDSNKQPHPPEVQVSTAMTILEIGYRLGISWSEVMQNGALVHGNWTWKSEYIVAHVMNSPKYKDFEYVEAVNGKCMTPEKKEIENFTCHLVGIRQDGKRDVGSEVSFEMAIAEGWWGRSGSKWKTMPKKMLRARAISFFNREWPTATLLGFKSQDEQEDGGEVQDAVVVDTTPAKKVSRPAPKTSIPEAEPVSETTPTVDDFAAAKDEQIRLANGDGQWIEAIEGCKTVAELDEVKEQFDL